MLTKKKQLKETKKKTTLKNNFTNIFKNFNEFRI